MATTVVVGGSVVGAAVVEGAGADVVVGARVVGVVVGATVVVGGCEVIEAGNVDATVVGADVGGGVVGAGGCVVVVGVDVTVVVGEFRPTTDVVGTLDRARSLAVVAQAFGRKAKSAVTASAVGIGALRRLPNARDFGFRFPISMHSASAGRP